MNNIEVVFSIPFSFFSQDFFYDDEKIEEISSELDEETEENFVDLISECNEIQELLSDVCNEYIDLSIFSKIKSVNDKIKDMNFILSHVSGLNKFNLYCDMIEVFYENLDGADVREFNYNDFSSTILDEKVGDRTIYSYFNTDHPDSSICYLNYSIDKTITSSDFDENTNVNMIYIIFHCLSEKCEDVNNPLLIHKNLPELGVQDIISSLKLHLLVSGDFFHNRKIVDRTPDLKFKKLILISNKYDQFKDAFTILSEYNSRKEILNKYLSLYHGVENFVYRLPIVKLTESNNGKMFSVRDFHLLYSSIDDKELPSLISFFKEVYSKDCDGGIYLNNLHDSFKNGISSTFLNTALKELQIKNAKNVYFNYNMLTATKNKQNLPSQFANIVYKIRNSIVHNKETEFHLSHAYLSDEIIELLANVVIPELENLIFGLVVKKNELIWYKHDKIMLYN
ncbi:TPA: hypothetical protein ACPJ1R_001781 [Vibrio alginolyticus]